MKAKQNVKRVKSKISIKTWLITCFCLIVILIIVGQTVFDMLFLEPFFIYRGKVNIEKSFYTVMETYDGGDDFSELNELAIKLENKYGIKLTLRNENGKIYSSQYTNYELEQKFDGEQPDRNTTDENSADLPKNQSDAPKLQLPDDDSAAALGSFFGFSADDFKEEPNIEISEQARGGRAIVLKGKFSDSDIYVIMSVSLVSISSTVGIFIQVSSIVAFVALIAAVVISVIMSKRISRRVVDIESVAKRVSELDFDCRADETVSPKELASLAGSINSMSGSLKQAVDDLQAANEALKKDLDYQKQLEKMRREFIANVSHEMKTPLGLLQIYSENLKNNVEDIDKDRYCDVIIEETGNLNDMVMSLLDISSIENGLSKMNFEETDLSALCREVANKFVPILEKFEFSQAVESAVFVRADRKYIEQAMKNYLSNAANHTPAGGKIQLSLERRGGTAVFSVKNDGKNISPDDMENIWDAFYKSDKARTRTPGNNVGLGLYIVKTVIEKHSGEYGARNYDGGVEFYFTLPPD